MEPLKVDGNVFSTKKRGSHIAALSHMPFVTHTNLKVAKITTMRMGLLESKNCAHISNVISFTILVI